MADFISDRTDDSFDQYSLSVSVLPLLGIDRKDDPDAWIHIPFGDLVQEVKIKLITDSAWTSDIVLVDSQGSELLSILSILPYRSLFRITVGRTSADLLGSSTLQQTFDCIYCSTPGLHIDDNGLMISAQCVGDFDADIYQGEHNEVVSVSVGDDPVDKMQSLMASYGMHDCLLHADPNCKPLSEGMSWSSGPSFIAVARWLAAHTVSSNPANADDPGYVFSLTRTDNKNVVTFAPRTSSYASYRVHNFVYGGNDVISVKVIDQSLAAALMGGTWSTISADAPTEDGIIKKEFDKAGKLSGQAIKNISTIKSKQSTAATGASQTNILLPSSLTALQADADLGRFMSAVKSSPMQLEMMVRGTFDVRPFDFVDFVYNSPVDPTHVVEAIFDGRYMIMGVEHVFNLDGWVTELALWAERLPSANPNAKVADSPIGNKSPAPVTPAAVPSSATSTAPTTLEGGASLIPIKPPDAVDSRVSGIGSSS